MTFQEANKKLIEAASAIDGQIRWCDEPRFREENIELAPGAYLNKWGYWVAGTTIGGSAIVLSSNDEAVRFAGRGWYNDDHISYENVTTGEWHDLPYSQENIDRSLFTMSRSIDDFLQCLENGQIDDLLDRID